MLLTKAKVNFNWKMKQEPLSTRLPVNVTALTGVGPVAEGCDHPGCMIQVLPIRGPQTILVLFRGTWSQQPFFPSKLV